MRLSALVVGALSAIILATASTPSAYADATQTNTNSNATSDVAITIQPGDSLSKIATAHQTTYMRLYDANEYIKDPNLIYPGKQLTIPAPGRQLPSRALPTAAPAPVTKPQPAPATAPAPAAPVASAAPSQAARVPAPAAPAAPAYTPAPAPAAESGSIWTSLAQCESGGNWSINTGNGFYGGLQFTLSSWHAAGGSGYPHQASAAEQIARAKILQSKQGWGAWPACSAKLGLR